MAKFLYQSLLIQGNTGQNFPYYREKKTGKPVFYKNEFGEKVERGPFISEQTKIFDLENEHDKEIVTYLSLHPFKDTKFKLIDLDAEARIKQQKRDHIGSISRKIFMMSNKEAPAFFNYLDMEEYGDSAKAELVSRLNDPATLQKVEEALNVNNLPLIVSIRNMVKWGVIKYENGTYIAAHNNEMLGISEIQAAKSLEEQRDLTNFMEKEWKRKEVQHRKQEKKDMDRLTNLNP